MQRLLALKPGEPVTLRVDGFAGKWLKMNKGRDGRPTDGLKPQDAAKAYWGGLYKQHRGKIVSVEIVDPGEVLNTAVPSEYGPGGSSAKNLAEETIAFRQRLERADPVMRKAAIAALLDAGKQIYAPDDNFKFSRDEIYDRDEDGRG